jgi:AhpD family alkylhydroperoxidase
LRAFAANIMARRYSWTKEDMDARTTELVAIGASVSAHCQPCLAYHMRKCRELGVGEEDIRAAIDVGHMMEKGASTAMREYVGLVFSQAQSQRGACCSDSKSECC